MSDVTTNLSLNKFGGNNRNLDAVTRQAAADANLDVIDGAIGALQLLRGLEVDAANVAIAIKEGTVIITKTTAAALTLAAPTAGLPSAGGDDGRNYSAGPFFVRAPLALPKSEKSVAPAFFLSIAS